MSIDTDFDSKGCLWNYALYKMFIQYPNKIESNLSKWKIFVKGLFGVYDPNILKLKDNQGIFMKVSNWKNGHPVMLMQLNVYEGIKHLYNETLIRILCWKFWLARCFNNGGGSKKVRKYLYQRELLPIKSNYRCFIFCQMNAFSAKLVNIVIVYIYPLYLFFIIELLNVSPIRNVDNYYLNL